MAGFSWRPFCGLPALAAPGGNLPERFGKWTTVFKRFREWVKRDVFQGIFDALSEEPDMEYAMIDGTIIKVYRHGQGAQAIGKSKGGLTTKILALTDALGNQVYC